MSNGLSFPPASGPPAPVHCVECGAEVAFDLGHGRGRGLGRPGTARLTSPVSGLCPACIERLRLQTWPSRYNEPDGPRTLRYHGRAYRQERGAWIRTAADTDSPTDMPTFAWKPCDLCEQPIEQEQRSVGPWFMLFLGAGPLARICVACAVARDLPETDGSIVLDGRQFKRFGGAYIRQQNPWFAHDYPRDARPCCFPCGECGADVQLVATGGGRMDLMVPPLAFLCEPCAVRLDLRERPADPDHPAPWAPSRDGEWYRCRGVWCRRLR